MSVSNRTAATWALAWLGAVACRSPQGTVTAADGGAATLAAPTAASGDRPSPAPGAPPDLCEVVPAADMAAASGLPIVKAEPQRDKCVYATSQGTSYIVRVAIRHNVFIGGMKQDATGYMRQMRVPDQRLRFVPAVEIAGLGDEAIVSINSSANTPNVPYGITALARKGDSIAEIIHGPGVSVDAITSTARRVLPKVLATL